MLPLIISLMDEWTHLLEPTLEVQLPTPVTLATPCLVHSHVLVEQMETGHPLNHFVEVSEHALSAAVLICECLY